jgi:hypothetical protein
MVLIDVAIVCLFCFSCGGDSSEPALKETDFASLELAARTDLTEAVWYMVDFYGSDFSI